MVVLFAFIGVTVFLAGLYQLVKSTRRRKPVEDIHAPQDGTGSAASFQSEERAQAEREVRELETGR